MPTQLERTLKKKLNAANAALRAAQTRLAEQENHRGAREFAEGRARRLSEDLDAANERARVLEKREVDRTKARPMSDAELFAIAAMVLTEHGPTSDTRSRLSLELERRGALPYKSPWASLAALGGAALGGAALWAALGRDRAAAATNPPATP